MPSQEELAHQRNKDVATIEALRRNRSDLSKPHLLEHHFNAYAEAAASQLVTKAISLGYNCEGIDKESTRGRPIGISTL